MTSSYTKNTRKAENEPSRAQYVQKQSSETHRLENQVSSITKHGMRSAAMVVAETVGMSLRGRFTSVKGQSLPKEEYFMVGGGEGLTRTPLLPS